MEERLIAEVDKLFAGKVFLSIEEVASLLCCDPQLVYNWTRRNDATKRPPKVVIGRVIRFPKHEFVRWLLKEQGE